LKDVQDFILICECCKEKDNRKTKMRRRIPGFIPEAQHLLEIVNLDLCEYDGNNFLTIVDAYSGFKGCQKVQSKSSDCIEASFREWMSMYGRPTIIISDRGSEFEFVSKLRVYHRRTAA
jgi:hypothetical protein